MEDSPAVRRVQKEIVEVALHAPENVLGAGPVADDIFCWSATLRGPPDTPYEAGTFFLDIHFPKQYPFKPPKIRFRTRIYHCNINSKGEICLDTLKNKWNPTLTISKVLLSILVLLADPNPEDPLCGDIAQLLICDRAEHDRIATEWTRRYATFGSASAAAVPATSTSSSSNNESRGEAPPSTEQKAS